jgi:3-oxoadipate enol-lactonase
MPILELDGVRVEHRQEGRGPQLLLLHSLLTDLTVFERVLPPLAAQCRVTLVDLPGFGASSPVRLETVADHADHLARVMEALALPRDTDVFGNGFGAFVALELAVRHGARFRRLVVADTLAAFPEPARAPFRAMAERVRGGGMAAVLDTAIARMFPPEFAAANGAAVAARKKALAAVDPECFARACLALAGLDLSDRLDRIRNPTLVLCGTLDLTTPAPLARDLAQRIPGARYEDIPGSGHCPMLEQPGALVRLIEGFLGAQPQR